MSISIAFIHPHKAFLPEIAAYTDYFNGFGIHCFHCRPGHEKQFKADVNWYFMGIHMAISSPKNVVIHEYPSASTAPLASMKNLIKKTINSKPDFRLFLNEYVQKKFAFGDDVPFGYRDMGVPANWLHPQQPQPKQYDFIYTGSMAKNRHIEKLVNAFTTGTMRGHTLMLVGDTSLWRDQYSSYPNLLFAGPVQHNSIKHFLLQAKYAINYVPDQEPYNRQTSTKLLEYAALKMPIISTRYAWVEDFTKQYGGSFFFVDEDLFNLDNNAIAKYPFECPALHNFTWEKQIQMSGVLEFLERKFPALHFHA